MNPHARTLWEAHGLTKERANELSDFLENIIRPADESERVQLAVSIEAVVNNVEEHLWLTEQVFMKLGELEERSMKRRKVLFMNAAVRD